MLTGTCLCGDVAYEIDGPLEWMAHCHCSMCRKMHGTAFATFVTFQPEALRWVRGADAIRAYTSSPGSVRNSCRRCGSKLPSTEPFAYAFAAPLSGELGIRPSEHLCVASKAPWHTISDDLPQHDGLPRHDVTPVPRHTEPAVDRVRGGCLCGAVAYELEPLDGGAVINCHCSRCRRSRGSVHGSNLFVDNAAFRWLRGEEHVTAYKVPEAERYAASFCAICGSTLPMRTGAANGFRAIPCGTLDDDPGVVEGLHLMVGSKAAWHVISDDLPQAETYPADGVFPRATKKVTAPGA